MILAKKYSVFFFWAFWLAILLLPAGCAVHEKMPAARMPAFDDALGHLKNRKEKLVSFAMQGEMEVFTPTEELYGDHHIEAMAPDRIRAEIIGPFGRPVLRLSVDSMRLMVLDYRANRAFRGRASRENLARFLGLYLSPHEIYALLTGSVPLSACSFGKLTRAADPEQARLFCFSPNGKKMGSLLLGLPDMRVLAGDLGGNAGKVDCRFSDFVPIKGMLVPKRLIVSDTYGRKVILDNQEVLINPPLRADAFSFDIPPEVEVTRLP